MILFCLKMGLTISACGWYFLALVLFVSSFGPLGGLWLIFYIFAFLAGLFSFLYVYAGQKAEAWILESSKAILKSPSIGIPKLVTEVCREKSKLKIDKRMTGSNIIDEVLQELLDYIYRDYIHQWYHKISDNQQFHYDIHHTLQRVIIAFSERAKDVDLIPYITTRLVDDFASHIRLYRRTLTKIKEHRKDDTKPPVERDSLFFDLELEMEKNICRDHICLNEASERQFLQDVSEVLMFLLLPEGDFHNKLFRYIVREVVVNGILLPTVNLLSDPDFINQTISWPCKETMFNSESFLTILRTSDSIEELQAIKEKVDYDIARQRSKDTGGDDDTLIKQQLGSLLFVQSMCESRIQRLNEGGLEDTDLILPGSIDMSRFVIPGQKLYSLSFDVVLNNNIALSYFIEFMTSIGIQNYLFFYLTVEGYRVSAEQQISAALLTTSKLDKFDLETLHDAATSIFNQYLSEKAVPKLKINDLLVKIVQSRIDRGEAMDTIFDDVQAKVSDLMQEDVRFFPAFKKSQLYIKLLIELDLIQDGTGTTKSDDGQQVFDDELLPCSRTNSLQASSEDFHSSCDSLSSNECSLSYQVVPNTFTLGAYISNTGVCREHGKSYAVYLITVSKKHPDGSEDTWDVYRRYSDFHDLHMILQEKFDSLSGLILPSKKAFDNMNKEFLEKRKVGLNTYLQILLTPGLLNTHRGLLEMVYQFLEHIHWEREKSELARKMDTIVNPLKSSVRNVGNIVRSMPNNFADGVARVSGGFRNIPNNMLDGVGKMLNVKGTNFHNLLSMLLSPDQPVTMSPMMKAQELERGKVSASLDLESDEDSIPLHIMLLLMDEVFDLKSRNQWLRRRIVAILQQIAKTMFGDSINRKIVDHVSWLTCPEQVAEYMRLFRDSLWPSGTIAEPQQIRDHNTKMRTRVVCKAKLFGSLSEELRHLIGLETTRQGVMLVFNMFQHQKLNRRLVYVILEGLLETIFPDNKFQEAFHKIHSQSPRVKQQKKEKASLSSSGSRNSLHRRMRSD